MAALQQELSLVAVERSDRTRKQKHFRLVADPSIAVSRIEATLQGIVKARSCGTWCVRLHQGHQWFLGNASQTLNGW